MILKILKILLFSCTLEVRCLISLNCESFINNEYELKLNKCKLTKDIYDKLDSFVYDNGAISKLSITNSNLTEIPPFICRLTNLTELDLSANKILYIPQGCFNNKIKLQYLYINDNELRELRDGTFDSLKNLKKISCQKNRINLIDPNVFSNVTDLPNLVEINLQFNNLQTLDAWPFIRIIYIDYSLIDLSSNQIENFTNDINFKVKYDQIKKFKFKLLLEGNRIRNLMSAVTAYFTDLTEFISFVTQIHDDSIKKIILIENKFVCDCIDYPLLRLKKYAQKSSIVSPAYCREPVQLYGRKIDSLSLDELFCDVSQELQCPAKCVCKKQPYNGTFHVLCSSKYLTDFLPTTLPSTKTPTNSFAQYKLLFQNTSIKNLSPRTYFNNTIWLDLSYTKINEISDETWNSIKNIKKIFLHNTEINILPKIVLQETGKFEILSIYNNPIACDCENIWFRKWILNRKKRIDSVESIICKTPHWLKGKSIMHIKDEEFCTDPKIQNAKKTTFLLVFVILAIIILLIFLCVFFYYYRVKINAILYIHPFDRDECDGEDMIYDAFISSSYQDRESAIKILELLESRRYVVCYHERDFILGESIENNIAHSLSNSRRVLCLISQDFLNSKLCMQEFDMARQRDIQIKRNRLILMLLQPSEVILSMVKSPSFEHFFKSFTYLNYQAGSQADIESLLYAMPIKPLEQQISSESISNSIQSD